MNLMEAIEARRSVRSYTDRKIEGEALEELRGAVAECNRDGDMSIRLCLDEPDAFSGMMARYGKFKNVRNYIALIGKKEESLEEKSGYYGEKIVLRAQQLGLNTCWVAMSYSRGKSAAKAGPGEKLLMVISLGYGDTQGVRHKSKALEKLGNVEGGAPEWFISGVRAAQLAPTAMNQQKFRFELDGATVRAIAGSGLYTKVDLGIAKCHFEIGAGGGRWTWGK